MRPELLINRRGPRRWTRRLRAAGTALAVVAGLSIAAVTSAAASAPPAHEAGGHAVLPDIANSAASGVPTAAGAPAAQPQAPQNTTVTLPTGDQVQVTTAGDSQQATPIPAGTVNGRPRSAATFIRFAWDGDQYVVPDTAVPFLGSTFDPRLFDVSYLARAHLGTPGSGGTPVRISYTSATQTASVPGLHVTSRSGATASGTITTTGARLLGGLLAARWQAVRSHHSSVPVGRLPGIKSISLARPAGAPPLPAAPGAIPARADAAASGLPYYTLTLNFTDQNGNPGTFAGFAQNLGNVALGTSFTTGSGGSESLSVPKGTYSLEFSVLTPDSSGTGFDTALVVKPQVTVNANTTVSLDARTAVPYQVTPPQGASAPDREDIIGFWRTSHTGGGCAAYFVLGGCGPFLSNSSFNNMYLYSVSPNSCAGSCADELLATPTAPVSEGSVFFDVTTQLYSGPNGPAQSQYVFDFPHQTTIPSSLTYTIPATALTTVHSDLQSPPSASCTTASDTANSFVYFPVGNGIWQSEAFQATAAAGERTDYWYSGDPRLDLWQYEPYYYGCELSLALNGPIWSIRPGEQITGTWNKAPLVPSSLAPPYWASQFDGSLAADYDPNGVGPDPRSLIVCTACRQGDIATFNVLQYGGSGPAQYNNQQLFDAAASAVSFYRNGTLAIDGGGPTNVNVGRLVPLGLELPLLSRPATYRLDWTEDGLYGDAPPGASVETDWVFRSGPDGPPARLPATEICAPDATRSCSLLPLLFPSYNLPLNTSNQATAGSPEPINFTVTGQQNAPLPRGLSATVSASFDGGQTWTTPQNAASLGNGQFTTTISQPALSATNGFVSLRVTARDGFGDSVTQTITDAYGLTS